MTSPPTLLESCVTSLEAAIAAERGGAGRVELCVDLEADGTSPPIELVRATVTALRIPVMVLIRPRAGDFVYTTSEAGEMVREVAEAKAAGVSGIVVGALTPGGEVDRAVMQRFIEVARPLPLTFHRAFDRVADQLTALDALIQLGVARVLTSGGRATAAEGVERLGELVARGRGRIGIVAGGGIRAGNAAAIVRATGVTELHLSADAAGILAALRR